MLGIMPIVLTSRIVQECEQLEDSHVRPRRLGQAEAVLTYPSPMRGTMNSTPVQDELSSDDPYELLVDHSLVTADEWRLTRGRACGLPRIVRTEAPGRPKAGAGNWHRQPTRDANPARSPRCAPRRAAATRARRRRSRAVGRRGGASAPRAWSSPSASTCWRA